MGNCIQPPTAHQHQQDGAGGHHQPKGCVPASLSAAMRRRVSPRSRGSTSSQQQQQQQQRRRPASPYWPSGGGSGASSFSSASSTSCSGSIHHSAASASAAATAAKRRLAAGAPVVSRPNASFLTRKDSEFGVVRPRHEKITLNYVIGDKLGEGNTAVVRQCVDKRDGRAYAVKIFRKTKLSLVDVTGLLEEVAILAHTRHPNIIEFHDFLEDSWYYYLVCELVDGGELFDRISKKVAYTEKEARDLFRVLVGAVAHLHKNHVVHRDLKPENLLLKSHDDDICIKLADFGYAVQVWPDEPGLRSQCGTPCYIAPEILKRQPYGKPVDMWSVGVITYILLCGYAPFYDEDQRVLFAKIRRGVFAFDEDAWGHISPEAKDLVARLLTTDPTQRLTAEAALMHPWLLEEDKALLGRSLDRAQSQLRKFNARRKFRAGVRSVMAANKLRMIAQERSRSRSPSPPTSVPSSPARPPAQGKAEQEQQLDANASASTSTSASSTSGSREAATDASSSSSSSSSSSFPSSSSSSACTSRCCGRADSTLSATSSSCGRSYHTPATFTVAAGSLSSSSSSSVGTDIDETAALPPPTQQRERAASLPMSGRGKQQQQQSQLLPSTEEGGDAVLEAAKVKELVINADTEGAGKHASELESPGCESTDSEEAGSEIRD